MSIGMTAFFLALAAWDVVSAIQMTRVFHITPQKAWWIFLQSWSGIEHDTIWRGYEVWLLDKEFEVLFNVIFALASFCGWLLLRSSYVREAALLKQIEVMQAGTQNRDDS